MNILTYYHTIITKIKIYNLYNQIYFLLKMLKYVKVYIVIISRRFENEASKMDMASR